MLLGKKQLKTTGVLHSSSGVQVELELRFFLERQVSTTGKKKLLSLGESQKQALSSSNSRPAEISVLLEETPFHLCSTVQLTKAPSKPDFEIKTVPKHVDN